MSSRSARNSLLAAGAAIGVVAAILQVVSASLALADFFSFPTRTWLKVSIGLSVLGWAFVLAAFCAALVGFLIRSRGTRSTVLAVSAGLFVGYGLSTLAAALIDVVESWDVPQPWEFLASDGAGVGAGTSLAIAALLVAIGVVAIRPDGLLGWGSTALAGGFALLCAVYSFELAGFHEGFFTPPGRVSWGLGTTAGGYLVAAVGGIAAGIAFLRSNGRRKSGVPWQAQREGSLGAAAIVFGVGFLVTTVGLMLLATESGGGRSAAEQWLRAVAVLLLALAAVCGAVGFFLSRRDAGQRPAAQAAAAETG